MKFIVSKQAAQRIVEAGTQTIWQNIQKLKRPVHSMTPAGIAVYGTLAQTINSSSTQIQVTLENESSIEAKCPLLTSGTTILSGTKVICIKDIYGDWLIVATEC